jgi:hypothetical protein
MPVGRILELLATGIVAARPALKTCKTGAQNLFTAPRFDATIKDALNIQTPKEERRK